MMLMAPTMECLPIVKQGSLRHATLLLLILLILLGLSAQGLAQDATSGEEDPNPSPYNFTFMIRDHENVSLTFREDSILLLTVNWTNYRGDVKLRSADQSIFTLVTETQFEITENTTFPFHVEVKLRGEYVGRSELKIVAIEASRTVLGMAYVNVYTPFRELSDAATIILTVWLVISYVIMAAKVEPRVLLKKIKPPWGIVMGMVCQFILMPPLAFGLAKVFGLTGATAVGLVLVGTCPGGFFSNIEVLLLDCDLVLSLTMTTFSTFLAVGMMPLNLLIYAQPFVDGDGRLETPFRSLLIQLCGLVLPLVIGVPFFQRFKRAREICLKLVKPFTFILMLLGVVLFIPSQYYIFFGNWKVWTTSAVLPLFGAFLGMSIARIANFGYIFSITVAIETGCQNTLLAVSVAKLYYQDPESDIVAIIPLLIAMVTGFEGIAIAAVYVFGRCIHTRRKKGTESAEDGDNSTNQTELNAAEATNDPAATPVTANGQDEHLPTFRYLFPTTIYAEENGLQAPAFEKEGNEVGERSDKAPVPSEDQQCGIVNNGFVIDQHAWL